MAGWLIVSPVRREPSRLLIVVNASDGGDAHAMGTNLSLMAQLVFD